MKQKCGDILSLDKSASLFGSEKCGLIRLQANSRTLKIKVRGMGFLGSHFLSYLRPRIFVFVSFFFRGFLGSFFFRGFSFFQERKSSNPRSH